MMTMDNAVPDWADTIGDTRLIEFVKARLDEDEAAARRDLDSTLGLRYLDADADAQALVSLFDADRVLREVEIKHAHLDQYRMAVAACQMAGADESGSLTPYRDAAWGAVLIDSRAWSDHPDFDAKWK